MPSLPSMSMSMSKSKSKSIIHNLKPAMLVSPSPSLHHTCSFPLPLSFKAPIFCSNPSSSLTRRLFLPSVSGIWDALTGGNNNAREALLAIRRGMSLFRQVLLLILLHLKAAFFHHPQFLFSHTFSLFMPIGGFRDLVAALEITNG